MAAKHADALKNFDSSFRMNDRNLSFLQNNHLINMKTLQYFLHTCNYQIFEGASERKKCVTFVILCLNLTIILYN